MDDETRLTYAKHELKDVLEMCLRYGVSITPAISGRNTNSK